MGKKQRQEEKRGQVVTFHQSADFFYERGMKAYRRQDLQHAIKYLKRAAHLEKEPFILCQLSAALSEAGDYHQSNQVLLTVLRIDASMKECYYFMANNYAYLGLFHQAKKYAEQYLEVCDNEEMREEVLDLLEVIAMEEDDEEFEGEDELIIMQERANTLIRNGELSDAVAALEEIIEAYPEFWSAYNNLAITRFQLGDVEEALAISNTVLEKNPGNLHALCNSTIFLYSFGQQKRVNWLVASLERVYPMMVEQKFKLGTTFATVGRFDLAYKWLRPLRRQGYEKDVSFHYWLAYAAYMMGDTEMALKTWSYVVEVYPEKKGKEPWASVPLSEYDQPVLLKQLKHAFQTENDIEKKMLALYLMNELQMKQKIEVFSDVVQSFSHMPVLSEWARYLFLQAGGKAIPPELKGFEKCAQIANILYSHTKKDDALIEECLQLWFRTFVNIYDSDMKISNVLAWSAAVEYIVRLEQKQTMTQTEIGNIYNVSPTTIRKYIQTMRQVHGQANH